MPTISVIVPVYNVEKYIHRCINSILAQTFNDFELILVDDGSPDRSGAICDEYAENDNRIRVFHRENGGVSAARNTGIAMARGKYITFCDSDDYYNSDWLSELYSAILQSNADLVSAGYTKYDQDGAQLMKRKHEKTIYHFQSVQESITFLIKNVLQGGIGWEIWTKLFKSEIIQTNSIQFCETCDNFAEDLGFVLEYLLYTRDISVIESISYGYTQHPSSMMSKSKGVVKLNAVNEISKHFGKRYFELFHKKVDKDRFAVIHFLIMWNQYKIIVPHENYPSLPDEIKKINDLKWYRRRTLDSFAAYKVFVEYFGKSIAQKLLLLSSYCLHKNWKLHTYISAIFYNYIYSER